MTGDDDSIHHLNTQASQPEMPIDSINEVIDSTEALLPIELDKTNGDTVIHYPHVGRSERKSSPAYSLGYNVAMSVHQARMRNDDPTTPINYQQATSGSNRKILKGPMDTEMDQIRVRKTWKLVPLPEGARTVKIK